jgi:catechol 2,3-dioxygenase-like lactoylglutathione lyase family enzyme
LGNDTEGFVIDRISSVTVQVSDQDQALDFYTSKLGFTKQTDERFGEDFRWVTVMPPGAQTQIVLAKGFAAEAAPIGKFTGIVPGRLRSIPVAWRHLHRAADKATLGRPARAVHRPG